MPRKMRKESGEDVAGALLVLQRMLQGVTQFRGGQIEREERDIERADLERRFGLSERGLSLREEEFGLREQKQTFATQAGLLEKFHEGGLRPIDPNTGQPMILSEDREAALQLEFLELRGEKLQKEIDDFGKRTPAEDADLRLKKAKADRAVLELENLQKGLKADGSPIGEKDKGKPGFKISPISPIADPLKQLPSPARQDSLRALQAGEPFPEFETPEDERSIFERVLPGFLGGKPAPTPTRLQTEQGKKKSVAEMTPEERSAYKADLEAKASGQIPADQQINETIKNASREYNIPIELLEAVIKQESAGDTQAVSSAGAEGLMQLMPETARGLGVTDSFDITQNIMGGAKYLKQMIDKFGSTEKALAAYNAGPGNVLKYEGIPPFPETKDYVRKIMEDFELRKRRTR